jgi:hypothetical protein
MKILHVVFSCNRLNYLTQSIESWPNLDYGGHEITRLIVDDYPRTRNDSVFELLGKTHNTLLWRNSDNLGLSVTWTNFFNWLKTQNYDYILHQEDDVVLKGKTRINDMIECLETDSKMASVVLQRQPWYFHETPSTIEANDVAFKNYWYSKNTKTFPIIFSLYRKSIAEYPFQEYWNFNLNEGMIMVYLNHFHSMYSATLKSYTGGNLIEHIGEESTGKRILPGEPRYEYFAHMDPNKVYTSREGKLVED